MKQDVEKLIQLSKKCATEAGKMLKEGFSRKKDVIFEDSTDVKLSIDVKSEVLIREILGENAPFPIIGEEKGGEPTLLDSDQYFWVVDPLDGTFNYYRGIPHCCVSIGLMKGRDPIFGVIHDFNVGETFVGSESGFFINDQQVINPDWASEKEKASIIINFPHGSDVSDTEHSSLLIGLRDFKKVRINGSAALGLAYVAAGRSDAFWAKGIRLWDVAGALAMLKAVGATFRLQSVPSKDFGVTIWASANKDWSWPL